MYEKISEKSIRKDKVKRLKTKILTEIDEEFKLLQDETKTYLSSDEFFNHLIKKSFALLNLKEYIEIEDTFMFYEAEYPDDDVIVYTVSDKNLEIWLQEDYSFVFNFLFKAEEYNFDVFPLLNERYFAYSFTNIFDSAAYETKMKQQKM